MTRHSIGNGVYADDIGGFWTRPWINRRRTWRKLKAVKEREAIREANTTDYESKGGTFLELADEYLKARCPNRRLESRPETFVEVERVRLANLKSYFGRYQPEEIKMPLCLKYKAWRGRTIKKGTGERTVDLDLNTLSNVLNFGVAMGRIEFNFIRSGRPTFRRDADVAHSREKAPQSGDEIHRIATHFLSSPRSEVFAWLTLFGAMTGCRIGELISLRLDGRTPDDPGFVSGDFLFIRRSKGGVHPYCRVSDDIVEMFRSFLAWHKERYPKSPWFFPGRLKGEPVVLTALNNALRDATGALKLQHITPHGLRSFYVTKRRSDGAADSQIAAEIGDKTVDLIHKTYGDRPANWTGGEKLEWKPTKGEPAWKSWRVHLVVH